MIKEKIVNNIAKKMTKNIVEDSKNAKSYNTGLMFEHLFVASLNKLEVPQLENCRNLINKIIRDKNKKVMIIKSNIEKNKNGN